MARLCEEVSDRWTMGESQVPDPSIESNAGMGYFPIPSGTRHPDTETFGHIRKATTWITSGVFSFCRGP